MPLRRVHSTLGLLRLRNRATPVPPRRAAPCNREERAAVRCAPVLAVEFAARPRIFARSTEGAPRRQSRVTNCLNPLLHSVARVGIEQPGTLTGSLATVRGGPNFARDAGRRKIPCAVGPRRRAETFFQSFDALFVRPFLSRRQSQSTSQRVGRSQEKQAKREQLSFAVLAYISQMVILVDAGGQWFRVRRDLHGRTQFVRVVRPPPILPISVGTSGVCSRRMGRGPGGSPTPCGFARSFRSDKAAFINATRGRPGGQAGKTPPYFSR